MNDISLETVTGKLNRVGYDTFLQALRHAKSAGNRNLEIAHWFYHIVGEDKSDISLTIDRMGLDRSKVLMELGTAVNNMRRNETEMPGISSQITDVLDRGWYFATLMFGEAQIRTGHLLLATLKGDDLRRALQQVCPTLGGLSADRLSTDGPAAWADSDEETMRPMDGTAIGATAPMAGGDAPRGQTPLARFATDMTAAAQDGSMDPVVGRDDEIRQLIDVLLRRRQNNPILTGEAGVGKTAVVEGFAQRLVSGDVPPQLRGVKLYALDIGLLQAGASMKGEFEQRLRSVIDEVQASPTPIILFIDEAHTLIGAGGAQGTGDAANLLKPALARGTLRTIGATTFSEYRQYFEKDPALTRRFQPVQVGEPSMETCCYMLRGITAKMEKHHAVRISDEAIVAAVHLSARYIPARQLPDKAVSLLDTASARVAISQSTTPAKIADLRATIARHQAELDGIARQSDIGKGSPKRVAELEKLIPEVQGDLEALQALHGTENDLVNRINALRDQLVKNGVAAEDAADIRLQLAQMVGELTDIPPESRMVYPFVDEQAVASVVSDWTGIPVGKMVKDEIEAILALPETLARRVVGQDHGLAIVAKRVETNRAKLDNPNKPIGVFMLCGPSGVGKTETALALAEALYGGEQNMITINMSEFQEAHTVSLLKGAPPGYVGYGEGGRLTEAVRRKPYSVVLLDEVEKAHPDVHELFFQVFDKGIMEDGNGRVIDFKNTLIILTSNVGTDIIMDMARAGRTRPSPEELEVALKPALLEVFPPALLGRIVTVPYFPLSDDMLAGIVRLQLNRISQRVRDNHEATLAYSDAVVNYIVSRCNDPDSGGRMIDNILTNSLLPELSRQVLNRIIERQPFSDIRVDVADGRFTYALEQADG